MLFLQVRIIQFGCGQSAGVESGATRYGAILTISVTIVLAWSPPTSGQFELHWSSKSPQAEIRELFAEQAYRHGINRPVPA